jgi:glutathione peroxidase-family protein
MAALHKKYGTAHVPFKIRLHILAFPCNDFGGQEPESESEIEIFARKKCATLRGRNAVQVLGI